MMQKLCVYLWWKGKRSQREEEGKSVFYLPEVGSTAASIKDPKGTGLSESLREKDKEKVERNQSLRRVRGGVRPVACDSGSSTSKSSAGKNCALAESEACVLAELYVLVFHPYFAR